VKGQHRLRMLRPLSALITAGTSYSARMCAEGTGGSRIWDVRRLEACRYKYCRVQWCHYTDR
jgi:hypothetical protein